MNANSKTINVTDLRIYTREIMDGAYFRGRHYVVKRNGRPMVVVLGVEEYARLVGEVENGGATNMGVPPGRSASVGV